VSLLGALGFVVELGFVVDVLVIASSFFVSLLFRLFEWMRMFGLDLVARVSWESSL